MGINKDYFIYTGQSILTFSEMNTLSLEFCFGVEEKSCGTVSVTELESGFKVCSIAIEVRRLVDMTIDTVRTSAPGFAITAGQIKTDPITGPVIFRKVLLSKLLYFTVYVPFSC